MLPAAHRLAGRASLRPADLDGEVFVKQPSPVPDCWCDFWMLVDELGHRPPVSPYTGANIEEWLQQIGSGDGIGTAPGIVSRYYARPEVAFVPLQDAAPATLVLACRSENNDRLVTDFVHLAQEVAATAAAADTPYEPVTVQLSPARSRVTPPELIAQPAATNVRDLGGSRH